MGRKNNGFGKNFGKITPFGQKRPSKRNSVRPPKGQRIEFVIENYGAPIPEVQRLKNYDSRQGTIFPPGREEFYNIETQFNYQTAISRYERSINIVPDRVNEDETEFYFFARRAPETQWLVTIEQVVDPGPDPTEKEVTIDLDEYLMPTTVNGVQVDLLVTLVGPPEPDPEVLFTAESALVVICPPAPPGGVQLGPEFFTAEVINDPQNSLDLSQPGSVSWEQTAGTNEVQFSDPTILYPFITFPNFGGGIQTEQIVITVTVTATGDTFDFPIPGTPQSIYRDPNPSFSPIVARVGTSELPLVRYLGTGLYVPNAAGFEGFVGGKFGDGLPATGRYAFSVPEARSSFVELVRTEVYLTDPTTGVATLSETFPAGTAVQPAIPFGITAYIVPVYDDRGVEIQLEQDNTFAYQPIAPADETVILQDAVSDTPVANGVQVDLTVTVQEPLIKFIDEPENTDDLERLAVTNGVQVDLNVNLISVLRKTIEDPSDTDDLERLAVVNGVQVDITTRVAELQVIGGE